MQSTLLLWRTHQRFEKPWICTNVWSCGKSKSQYGKWKWQNSPSGNFPDISREAKKALFSAEVILVPLFIMHGSWVAWGFSQWASLVKYEFFIIFVHMNEAFDTTWIYTWPSILHNLKVFERLQHSLIDIFLWIFSLRQFSTSFKMFQFRFCINYINYDNPTHFVLRDLGLTIFH